jgi:2-methylcitrate dehydratase
MLRPLSGSRRTLSIQSDVASAPSTRHRSIFAVTTLAVSGNATIIGTDRRTTPELASFANGAAFRYFDFNDTYVGRFSVHPSDHIAACLAVAEAERASARDLIVAIIIAYEVNCRLVDALDLLVV